MDENNKPYLPKQRGFMENNPKTIKAYSKDKKTFTKLPDPVQDPIVSMNIAFNEFDYTSELIEDTDPIGPKY